MSKSSLRFKGILYTVGILCDVECCIRQLSYPSTILYNITSIAYNHHTDIYSLSLLNIHMYLPSSGSLERLYAKQRGGRGSADQMLMT